VTGVGGARSSSAISAPFSNVSYGLITLEDDLFVRALLCTALLLTLGAPLGALAHDAAPAYLSRHKTDLEDQQAIRELLKTSTTAVTNGDKAAFESLLLNTDVPFSSMSDLANQHTAAQEVSASQYGKFRQAIFDSGVRFNQQFYNVHIEQDGDLAQVSLDFVTKETNSGQGGYGWKTLQLLKIKGRWKIASEFYTGYPLPKGA